jgi:hypothetical protein
MTAIMTIDEPRPRGTVMGERVGGPPLDEGENFFKCGKCGGWFDARDLAGLKITRARCRTRRAIELNEPRYREKLTRPGAQKRNRVNSASIPRRPRAHSF